MGYHYDIVFCIDINNNMMQCMERIKKLLREFPSKMIRAYAECGKHISNVRVKIITYGNKIEPDIKESRWFNISDVKGLEPEYYSAYLRYLICIDTSGNALALHAISKAIHTDWTQYENKKRHHIVVFSNSKSNFIDVELFENSTDIWMEANSGEQKSNNISLSQSSKYLMILAPDVYPWRELYESWTQVIYNPLEKDFIEDDIFYLDAVNALIDDI